MSTHLVVEETTQKETNQETDHHKDQDDQGRNVAHHRLPQSPRRAIRFCAKAGRERTPPRGGSVAPSACVPLTPSPAHLFTHMWRTPFRSLSRPARHAMALLCALSSLSPPPHDMLLLRGAQRARRNAICYNGPPATNTGTCTGRAVAASISVWPRQERLGQKREE